MYSFGENGDDWFYRRGNWIRDINFVEFRSFMKFVLGIGSYKRVGKI